MKNLTYNPFPDRFSVLSDLVEECSSDDMENLEHNPFFNRFSVLSDLVEECGDDDTDSVSEFAENIEHEEFNGDRADLGCSSMQNHAYDSEAYGPDSDRCPCSECLPTSVGHREYEAYDPF
ncbi:hypothetical protein CVT24_000111 [Panaeolus cyanescens]|uniref:Uncharacterized protein n=1 Tax=Panaeolus cyanescens TaxID=181874 RepID=A0A409W7J8_9AGAR|nr:hypothetical protein CVT24_000111 [Panaeolus cyanescens]